MTRTDATPAARRPGSRWLLAALPAAAVLVAQFAAMQPAFVDDQYIFYRYAENWAAGHGPVFNPGEYVEGFSSAAWLVLLTAAELVGISSEDAGPFLSLGLALGCLALLSLATRRLMPDAPLAAAIAALALAVLTGFAFYASSGMDTAVFTLALLASVVALALYVERVEARGAAGRRWTAAAVGCLVVLVFVRAEGFAYALLLALVAVAAGAPAHRRRLLVLPAAALGAIVALIAVRQAVFGEWLPATVMAKGYVSHFAIEAIAGSESFATAGTALREGVQYVGAPLLVLLAAIAVGVTVELRGRRRPPPLVLLALAGSVCAVAITIWAAGDWMPHDRFLVPIAPLVLLLAIWTAARVLRRLPSARGAVPAGVAAVAAVAAVGVDPGALGEEPPLLYEASGATGEALAGTPAREVVATHFAGRLAYEAGRGTYVRDMLGLTDIHNAKHGEHWVPSFGRTDFEHSLRGIDVLVSPVAADYGRLLDLASARGAPEGEYVLIAGRWGRAGHYTAVRARAPAREALERACRCDAAVLDQRAVAALAAFELDTLRPATSSGTP